MLCVQYSSVDHFLLTGKWKQNKGEETERRKLNNTRKNVLLGRSLVDPSE
jgi:hypothetical protein